MIIWGELGRPTRRMVSVWDYVVLAVTFEVVVVDGRKFALGR